jgi:hypothetical protein
MYSCTFHFFSSINCILAIFVIFTVPKTRNVILEVTDTLFDGVNYVQKGGAHLDAEGSSRVEEEDIAQREHMELEDIAPA